MVVTDLSYVSVILVSDWRPAVALRRTKECVPRDALSCCHRSERPPRADCVWLLWCIWLSGSIKSASSHLIFWGVIIRWAYVIAEGSFTHAELSAGVSGLCFLSLVHSVRCSRMLYVGMSVCLCSPDFPLAWSVFIEQPPQIPTMAKLPAQTHRQYASQSCSCVAAWRGLWDSMRIFTDSFNTLETGAALQKNDAQYNLWYISIWRVEQLLKTSDANKSKFNRCCD